jgi:hypothetical protein
LESKKAIKESWSEVFVKNKSSLRKPSDELEKKIVRKLTVVHNINYKKTANAYPIAM